MVCGKLRRASVTVEDVAADSTSEAYGIVQGLVLLEAAIEVYGLLVQQSPDLLRARRQELADRYKELASDGYAMLGVGVPVPDEEPMGPENHIDAHGLALEDETDISPLDDTKLRRRDML